MKVSEKESENVNAKKVTRDVEIGMFSVEYYSRTCADKRASSLFGKVFIICSQSKLRAAE